MGLISPVSRAGWSRRFTRRWRCMASRRRIEPGRWCPPGRRRMAAGDPSAEVGFPHSATALGRDSGGGARRIRRARFKTACSGCWAQWGPNRSCISGRFCGWARCLEWWKISAISVSRDGPGSWKHLPGWSRRPSFGRAQEGRFENPQYRNCASGCKLGEAHAAGRALRGRRMELRKPDGARRRACGRIRRPRGSRWWGCKGARNVGATLDLAAQDAAGDGLADGAGLADDRDAGEWNLRGRAIGRSRRPDVLITALEALGAPEGNHSLLKVTA